MVPRTGKPQIVAANKGKLVWRPGVGNARAATCLICVVLADICAILWGATRVGNGVPQECQSSNMIQKAGNYC